MFNDNKQIDPSKVAIYVRWSTDEQEKGTTMEVQLERCRKFVEAKGWVFSEGMTFVDKGESGGSLARPAMDQLRKLVKAGQVECVVVYALDRLSRSMLDTVTLVRQEWADTCALYSATQEFVNTNNPFGVVLFNILATFAEFERNTIRERTLNGKKKRAEQGRNAGFKYAYGYRRSEAGGYEFDGWDEAKQCFTGPAAIARRIFDQYLIGATVNAITDRLNADAIPSPLGGRWLPSTVGRILDNPVYMGTYRYGMTTQPRGKKRTQLKAPAFVVEDAVPALVSEDEFQQVQRLREDKRGVAPRTLGSAYLLSGKARCGKCGEPINGKQGSDKRYYSCLGRLVHKTCDCALIGAEWVEGIVVAELKKMLSGDSLRAHVETISQRLVQEVEERRHAVAALESELATLRRNLDKADADYATGELDARSFSRLTAKWEADLTAVEGRLVEARRLLEEAQATTVDVPYLGRLAERMDAWDQLTQEEMKQVLADVLESVTIYQEKSSAPKGVRNPNKLTVSVRPRTDLLTVAATTA